MFAAPLDTLWQHVIEAMFFKKCRAALMVDGLS